MRKVLNNIKKIIRQNPSRTNGCFRSTKNVSKAELLKRVQIGTEKAGREYSKTFEILARND